MPRFPWAAERLRFQQEVQRATSKHPFWQLRFLARRTARQFQRLLNDPERDTQIASIRFQPSAHQAALRRQRKSQQRPHRQRRGWPRLIIGPSTAANVRANLRMPTLPMLLLGARNLRQLTHVLNRGFAKFFRNQRQQPVPHAVAEKSNIPILRIFPPPASALVQKLHQRSAPKAEQRPHHLSKRAPMFLEYDQRMNAR